MKTYVLTVSRFFPATHKRKGEPTGFVEKILKGEKIHTIRANYPLWEKRIKEVQEGKAIISIRYWTGNPYRSKQEEFARLTKNGSIGFQKALLVDHGNFLYTRIYTDDGGSVHSDCMDYQNMKMDLHLNRTVSKNDGLSIEDFREWFKGVKNEMIIIHFTKFRYAKR